MGDTINLPLFWGLSTHGVGSVRVRPQTLVMIKLKKFYMCSVEHCIEEQTETIGKHVPLSNVSSQPFNAAHVELFLIEHHQILGSNSY